MQKTFVKIISRKVLTAAIVTGSPAFESSAENTPTNNPEIVSSNIQSCVEFKGASEDAFLFEVKVENPDAQKLTLEIRDDNGKIVSSKGYSETNFIKEIKLSNKEITAHYNFIVKTESNEPEHTFIVSITKKVTEEVKAA